jgi:membrane associated rhomboid family serine protease
VTHGLFFFLFVASIFRRDKSSVAIMMIAFLLYGGMTMTIFPREEGISFEYHFFGALAGVIAAIIWRDSDPKPVVKR